MPVILCHHSRFDRLRQGTRLPPRGRWVYFGENWDEARRIKTLLAPRGWEERDYRRGVNEIAAARKDDYVGLIDRLGHTLPIELWQISSIAEKNVESTLFLDLCRALWLRSEPALIAADPPLLVICARTGLQELLRTVAPNASDYREPSWRRELRSLRQFIRARWEWLRRQAARRLAAGRGPAPTPTELILRSWVDRRAFDREGHYRDIYFGGVWRQLREAGHRPALLPCFLESGSIPRLQVAAAREQFPVLLYEWLVPLTALIRVFCRGLVARLPRFASTEWSGLDVAPLLNEELRNDWLDNRVASYGDEALLAQALKRAGWSPRRLLYPMENQPWERVLTREMKKQFPECVVVGYQHTIVSPQHLFYLPGPTERGRLPRPDLILTTGEYTRALLRKYDQTGRIEVGGAWRFEMMLTRSRRTEIAVPPRKILLALPISRKVADEMTARVLELDRIPAGGELVVKPHPCAPLDPATVAALRSRPGVTVAATPTDQLLASADLVVYAGTSVCLEALASGVPVVSYVPAYVLTIDPLDGRDDLRDQVTDLDDLFTGARLWPAAAARFIAEYLVPPTAALAGRFAGG